MHAIGIDPYATTTIIFKRSDARVRKISFREIVKPRRRFGIEDVAGFKLGTSLHRAREAHEYLHTFSPHDMAEFMTWDDNDADTAIEVKREPFEVKEEPVFTTPTKRGPSNIRPMSPVGRKRIQLNPGQNLGSMSANRLPVSSTTFQEVTRINTQVMLATTWIPPSTPRHDKEFYARKKKQMDQKAQWAVTNALKNNKKM